MKKSDSAKIKDIAKAAKVSTATVSRVFSHHPYVNDEVRERILKLAKDMNYAPQVASTQGTFAIMTAGYRALSLGPYEMGLILPLTQRLFEENYNVQILSEHSIPYIHKKSFRAMISISPMVSHRIKDLGIPAVSINEPVEGMARVASDHEKSVEMAVDYLVARGHSKIAYLAGRWNNTWGAGARAAGYNKALEKHGIPFDERITAKFLQDHEIVEMTAQIMKESPSALIIPGEAFGCIINYAMYVLNKKIPDDISVIAFEDNMTSQYMTPPLTTISQDLMKLGTLAAETAIEISRPGYKDKAPVDILIENKLIERMSVKTLAR